MRINKFLTSSGFCSRREADRLIESGRVRINSRVAKLGDQVNESDEIFVDDRKVDPQTKRVYIMYHKPPGIICTTDQKIESNIVDAVNHPLRIFPIGRLDKDSTGLILLTNDGDIVNRILRAQFGHEKEYLVRLNKPYDKAFIEKMTKGVDIGDHLTKPCQAWAVDERSFAIILTEGKNRQIRRMSEALGYRVQSLKRVRIMNIELGKLKQGVWQDIPPGLLKTLQDTIDKQKPVADEFEKSLSEIEE